MSNKVNVITGGTGLLGSHIAEQLVRQGEPVRVLVRSCSDTSFLETMPIDFVPVNYGDRNSIENAVKGADVVYHCAAHVSDWGSWQTFQSGVVDVAKNVLDACANSGVGRVLFVSSVSVYGHPQTKPPEQIDEAEPLEQRMWYRDYYGQAKILAEREAHRYAGDITIVRPSWIYGPRDKVSVPRLIESLRAKRIPIIGSGDNHVNLIYVDDVARGCILAANAGRAAGEAYHLTNPDPVTQRQLFNLLTDKLGLPRIRSRRRVFVVLHFAFFVEMLAKLAGRRKPPTITRRAVNHLLRDESFSIDKAKNDLGWQPEVGIEEGMDKTLSWYFGQAQPQSERGKPQGASPRSANV